MPAPTIGPEFLVSSPASGVQMFPAVAAMPDGGFAIAWHDIGGAFGYVFERFDADATPRVFDGGGYTITASEAIENRIEIAPLATNQLAVVMVDAGSGDILYEDPEPGSINLSEGPEAGGVEEHPFLAVSLSGTITAGFIDTIGATARDRVTVTLTHAGLSRSSLARDGDQIQQEGVYAGDSLIRVYQDVAAGGEVRLLAPGVAVVSQTGSHPHVAALAEGGIAVTWQDAGQVFVRIHESNGTPRTGEIPIDGSSIPVSVEPHVCALQDGRVLVVWTDVFVTFNFPNPGSSQSNTVYGRIYNADGTPDSDAFVIDTLFSDTATPVTGAPRAAQLADGRVVVGYQDGFESDPDIKAKFLDPRLEGVQVAGTKFDDHHVGSAFDDAFVEGAGNDRVVAGADDDTVFGGFGKDSLQGQAGNDRVAGDAGADVLGGGADNDSLFGGAGNDLLTGGADADRITGGTGIDFAIYTSATSGVVVSLDGSLTATGDAAGDVLVEIEGLQGSGRTDVLRGDNLANTLQGLAGNDHLQGLAGNDLIYGGVGTDILSGGAGADRFTYVALNEGGDTVNDFSSVDDNFQFRSAGFGGLPVGTLAASRFQSRSDNMAQDADDRFIFRTTDKTLWFDANGSGAGGLTLIADLQATATMTNADIVLV